MTKALITEQQLVDVINSALRNDWPLKDCHCEVAALKRVNFPERNWEVELTSMGGASLLHTEECERLLKRVSNDLVAEYDVHWPA